MLSPEDEKALAKSNTDPVETDEVDADHVIEDQSVLPKGGHGSNSTTTAVG